MSHTLLFIFTKFTNFSTSAFNCYKPIIFQYFLNYLIFNFENLSSFVPSRIAFTIFSQIQLHFFVFRKRSGAVENALPV